MKRPLLHVHTPWRQIDQWLPLLLEQQLQPEIAFLATDLEQLDPKKLALVSEQLQQAKLAVTVHAPFMDLNPGALDPIVSQATMQRLLQALDAASRLQAKLMVIHPGYAYWHYDHKPQVWLEPALSFFQQLLPAVEQAGIRIGIENIFETTPQTLVQLLAALNHPLYRYCFDVGHWHLFAADQQMDNWLLPLRDELYHLHLHDNFGQTDQHLPLGEGDIHFAPLNSFLTNCDRPPSMTLEAHSKETLEASLQALPRVLPALF